MVSTRKDANMDNREAGGLGLALCFGLPCAPGFNLSCDCEYRETAESENSSRCNVQGHTVNPGVPVGLL